MPASRGRSSGRGMGDTANESLAQRNLVDINVATVEELSTLVGVGRSRAEAIVETRNVSLGLTQHQCVLYGFDMCFSFVVPWRIYIHRRSKSGSRCGDKFD
jgi:hypothetical protein